MHWREVDLDARTWTIPGERYKGRRPHLVPLSDALVEILKATPWADAKGYVFSARGEGDTPYANLVKPKARLDKESEVRGWVLHDLRRSCRTGLSRLGVPRDIAERTIGHAVGGRLGTTYDVHEYRDEKRAALDTWARYVLGLAARKPSAADAA